MVTLLGVLGALVVLFAAGAVATREGGGVLRSAPRDAPDLDLPAGTLAPDDLHRVRFGLALRGYRMAEVDVALDRAAQALAHEQDRVRRLERSLAQRQDEQRALQARTTALEARAGVPTGPPRQGDPRDEGLPALSPAQADRLRSQVERAFVELGFEVDVHPGHAVDDDGHEHALGPLAAAVRTEPEARWPALVQAHLVRALGLGPEPS